MIIKIQKEEVDQLIKNATKRAIKYSIYLDHDTDCYIRLYKSKSLMLYSNRESTRQKVINELLREAIQARLNMG